jgi:hypothetical protein
LYNATPSGNTAEAFNILGVLEPARRSGNSGRRTVLALLAIFVSAGAFAVISDFHGARSSSMALIDSALSPREAPVQKAAAPAIPVIAAAELDAQVTGAKIVSDEPAGKQEAGTGGDPGTNTNIGMPVLPLQAESATKSPKDSVNPSSPAAVTAAPDPGRQIAAASAEAPVIKAAPEKAKTDKMTHQAIPKPRQPHHPAARRKNDRDVDLIAALLTRVSTADADEKSAKGASASKGKNAPPGHKKSSVSDSSDKRNPVLARNQVHESLDVLVRRCRTLGLVDGELCRLRTCSGSWGKDPACPASGLPPEN